MILARKLAKKRLKAEPTSVENVNEIMVRGASHGHRNNRVKVIEIINDNNIKKVMNQNIIISGL
jgi:hypothetical protein